MKYELTEQIINETLAYLGTRPYIEVFKLITEIQSQATMQVVAPATPPKKEK